MRKLESGTVKRVSRQAPRVMRVIDSTTQASKRSTISFTMLPRKNAADDSDKPFDVPRYLQRKNERRIAQKTLTGMATSKDTLMAARNGNSVRELFVSRVSKEVKLDDLKNYVESKGFTVLNVKRVSDNEAKNNSFKLTVPVSKCDKLFDSSVWP